MSVNQPTTKAGWNFDNSYAGLPELFFSRQEPSPVQSPKIIKINAPLAKSLGLNAEELQNADGIAIFAGNRVPEGAVPLAQAYAGHQFGHFTMLGDGRALLIGEQITPQGERFDIQIKGSGRTPYSRGGDGRAAVGPMLREYIMSEAMHALGIPTTRSLAVVSTGESVIRETALPGAILTRVASSHIRVGTFQFASKWGSVQELQSLAEYTLQRHYPEAANEENRYLALLREVIRSQASLIAKWQLVGFIHGVMNTDNMTLSGETIDYGPCAFMDVYNPSTVFSSIDIHGRYAYGNQPSIAGWNLARLAEALLPVLHSEEDQAIAIAEEAISEYPDLYNNYWLDGMRAKLGLLHEDQQDEALISDLLRLMKKHGADYTNTFRDLTLDHLDQSIPLYGSEEFTQWYDKWQARIGSVEDARDSSYQLMKKSNPAIIPRNHRVEEALEAAVRQEDYSVMNKLLDVLADPFAYSPELEEYATVPESNCGYRTFCGT